MSLPSIDLLGVLLHRITAEEAVDHVLDALSRGEGGWIFTPNLDILRRLTRDEDYVATTSAATLRLADGMPLIWASRLQGTPLPARVAGSEIIWPLCERAARDGRSVLFLGGNPGSANAAAEVFEGRYPELRIAGIECPPLGFERDEAYVRALEHRLRLCAPDLCLVGLPSTKQDPLIARLMPLLPRTWFAGIGITFSFVAGEVKKPPLLMRRLGLEWFFRFLQEPRRLAYRYFVEGVPFAISLLTRAAWRRFRGPHNAPESGGTAAPHPGPIDN